MQLPDIYNVCCVVVAIAKPLQASLERAWDQSRARPSPSFACVAATATNEVLLVLFRTLHSHIITRPLKTQWASPLRLILDRKLVLKLATS